MISLNENIVLNSMTAVNFVNLNSEQRNLVLKWRNDQSIRQWMYNTHIIQPDEHNQFIESLKADSKNYYWLVIAYNTEYLGVINLNVINIENKNAYLGIYANPESQVKGKGTLLMQMLIHIAFTVFVLHTLKLEVLATNEKAFAFYEKFGFTQEGILREFVFRDNKWIDVIIMGLTNTAGTV